MKQLIIIAIAILAVLTSSAASFAQEEDYMPRDCRCFNNVRDQFYLTICHELEEAELPDAFFSLAAHESCGKTDVISKAGAVGLWQIMPATAVALVGETMPEFSTIEKAKESLKDPFLATKVAMVYLKDLYERFDHNVEWTIAAYNAGGTNLAQSARYKKGRSFKRVREVSRESYNLARAVMRTYKEYGWADVCVGDGEFCGTCLDYKVIRMRDKEGELEVGNGETGEIEKTSLAKLLAEQKEEYYTAHPRPEADKSEASDVPAWRR